MKPRQIHLHHKLVQKLTRLRKEAEQEGAYRVAKRIHAVLLNHDGHTSGEIARILDAPRSRVSEWLQLYQKYGVEGLLEGHRSGRPAKLQSWQLEVLKDIVESGPVAYGYLSGVWTSVMVAQIIQTEFGIRYDARHVRRLLHRLGFSVQRPKRQLAQADLAAQERWHRYTYPNLKKTRRDRAAFIFEDEVSFRQDSTLHATWARRGCQPLIPVTGQRNSVKMFGAVEIMEPSFHYHGDVVFNASTYLDFLEQLAPRYYPRKVIDIQDNASYHTDAQVSEWFRANESWFTAVYLPAYSPELNAAEGIWKYTRKTGTHNRYFENVGQLDTTVRSVFKSIQRNPSQIVGYIQPFL